MLYLVMKPTQNPLLRAAVIILNKGPLQTGSILKITVIKTLEEKTPLIVRVLMGIQYSYDRGYFHKIRPCTDNQVNLLFCHSNTSAVSIDNPVLSFFDKVGGSMSGH